MIKLEDKALFQFCEHIQADDFCLFFVCFEAEYSKSMVGTTDCLVSMLKHIRMTLARRESETFLFFCPNKEIILSACNSISDFMTSSNSPLFDSINEYISIDTSRHLMDRTLYAVNYMFKDASFRFAQTSFINTAFKEIVPQKIGSRKTVALIELRAIVL